MVCYGLTFWELRPLIERNGAIGWKLLQALAKRLRTAGPSQPNQGGEPGTVTISGSKRQSGLDRLTSDSIFYISLWEKKAPPPASLSLRTKDPLLHGLLILASRIALSPPKTPRAPS